MLMHDMILKQHSGDTSILHTLYMSTPMYIRMYIYMYTCISLCVFVFHICYAVSEIISGGQKQSDQAKHTIERGGEREGKSPRNMKKGPLMTQFRP